jgi:hypothetical protein
MAEVSECYKVRIPVIVQLDDPGAVCAEHEAELTFRVFAGSHKAALSKALYAMDDAMARQRWLGQWGAHFVVREGAGPRRRLEAVALGDHYGRER